MCFDCVCVCAPPLCSMYYLGKLYYFYLADALVLFPPLVIAHMCKVLKVLTVKVI